MRAELRSNMPRAAAGASTALAVFAVACSTPTPETNVWKSPTYAAGPMKNIAGFYGAYWGPGAPVYAQTNPFTVVPSLAKAGLIPSPRA